MKFINKLYKYQPKELMILLTCALGTSAVVCVGASGILSLLDDNNYDSQETKINYVSDYSNEEGNQSGYKEFAPGEHIISVDISDFSNHQSVFQLPYAKGYKIEGITSSKYYTVALFVNTDDVIAFPTGEEGKEIYDTFGVCINHEEKNNESDDSIIYEPGEHALAVLIGNSRVSRGQYECPEGYSVEDIALGKGKSSVSGTYIIYINNTEVKCKKDENGRSLEFGIPLEKEKVKSL